MSEYRVPQALPVQRLCPVFRSALAVVHAVKLHNTGGFGLNPCAKPAGRCVRARWYGWSRCYSGKFILRRSAWKRGSERKAAKFGAVKA